MEENWGFDSYDPPYYWSVQPSFFQSLAYMLWGATGLNIYLGVSCDCWTDYLAVDAGKNVEEWLPEAGSALFPRPIPKRFSPLVIP